MQVALATKFCMLQPNIYGSSVWILVLITILVIVFRCPLDFWKNLYTPDRRNNMYQ